MIHPPLGRNIIPPTIVRCSTICFICLKNLHPLSEGTNGLIEKCECRRALVQAVNTTVFEYCPADAAFLDPWHRTISAFLSCYVKNDGESDLYGMRTMPQAVFDGIQKRLRKETLEGSRRLLEKQGSSEHEQGRGGNTGAGRSTSGAAVTGAGRSSGSAVTGGEPPPDKGDLVGLRIGRGDSSGD